MGLDGYAESSAIWLSFKTILQKWKKHCSTLHSLATQIMGMERCDKARINVPEDTFLAVRITIESKIMEELHNLSEDIQEMETEQQSLSALLSRVTARCQHFLEQNNKQVAEFQQLQTIYSMNNHITILIAMMKVPLHKAQIDHFQSLQDFKQINVLTKPIENEVEKIFNLTENQ